MASAVVGDGDDMLGVKSKPVVPVGVFKKIANASAAANPFKPESDTPPIVTQTCVHTLWEKLNTLAHFELITGQTEPSDEELDAMTLCDLKLLVGDAEFVAQVFQELRSTSEELQEGAQLCLL